MVRLKSLAPILALCALALASDAQTVYWVGGFPNFDFGTATNWYGGALPLNNGTETLVFNASNGQVIHLTTDASFYEVSDQILGTGNSTASFTGSSYSLAIGAGGANASSNGTLANILKFSVPVTLAAGQTWSLVNDHSGAIKANGNPISGAYLLTLLGDNNDETFVLGSGSSTFGTLGGSVTVTAPSVQTSTNTVFLVAGASSSGPAGAPTSGPLGIGMVTLGDGTTLSVENSTSVTLGNPMTLGDQTNGNPVAFGGSSSQYSPGSAKIILSGPIALNDADLELDLAKNTTVTFSGALNGYTAGVCLDFGTTSGSANNSYAIVQGAITNVSRVDLEDGASVVFDGSGPSQLTGGSLSDIGVEDTTKVYAGIGSGYAAAGVTTFLGYLEAAGASGFYGTIGFDTTSGLPATFNTPIDVSSFTNFVGLGSSTQAILGASATITPNVNYQFGGGGGTLTVQSPLSGARQLILAAGNSPLTLVLSGTNSYTGETVVGHAALIFDSAPPSGGYYAIGSSPVTGYVGSTVNSGYSDGNANIQAFVNLFNPTINTSDPSLPVGVIGFDSLTGVRTVTSAIGMNGLGTGVYLGTATSVDYSGTITPNGTQYQFSGVKGGQVQVDTNLTGSYGLTVGLTKPIENSNAAGVPSTSSVILNGDNTYSGITVLNSGFLYVTNANAIGTGTLNVANVSGPTPVLAIPTADSAVALGNNIVVSANGVVLNTPGSPVLTLNGVISNLGSFDPVTIDGSVTLGGNNTYNGTTTINSGSTVTVGSDTGLGGGGLNASGSTLTFTSASPVLAGPVDFSSVTATFAGSPLINSLTMALSTLNFNGPAPVIDGLSDDATSSNNAIVLGSGTVLTVDIGGNNTDLNAVISGNGGLAVAGGANLNLFAANTYTGGTTVTGGSWVIASNASALGTGSVTLNNSGLAVNTGVTLTNPIVTVGAMGLAGYGTLSPGGSLVIQNNSVIAGGSGILNSGTGSSIPIPGTLTFGGGTSLTFGPNGKFFLSLADANGSAGTGYGTVNVGSTLSITATSINPFEVELVSFVPSTYALGPAINFNSSLPYSWTLVSATAISGFNSSYFTVDTTNFANSIGGGSFDVSQAGNTLMLNFTPVPEPSTWILMASGLFALGAAARRRRA